MHNQRMLIRIAAIFLLHILCLTAYGQRMTISGNDPHIRYTGRFGVGDSTVTINWTASSATVNFEGPSVNVTMDDELGNNFYAVIIDDRVTAVLHAEKGKKEYALASQLAGGKHKLELFKRTEAAYGKTEICNFSFDGHTVLLPPAPPKKRKIEFYGNSITCGYATEDTTGKDRGDAPYENGYSTYPVITARHFDADYSVVAKSGIGVTISWFPQVMEEVYDRLYYNDPSPKWDFTRFTPDIVVIDLFQNDAWLVNMPDHEQFRARFGTKPPTADFIIQAYRRFVKAIRAKYPKAKIICTLGNMDATREGSPWPGYVEKAVAALKDPRIYTCFFPFKGTSGHPSKPEQQKMAEQLTAFITTRVKW